MTDFSDILSKAKKMQEKMKEVQKTLEQIEVEGTAGGDLVKVVLRGDYEMKSISVNENAKNEHLSSTSVPSGNQVDRLPLVVVLEE